MNLTPIPPSEQQKDKFPTVGNLEVIPANIVSRLDRFTSYHKTLLASAQNLLTIRFLAGVELGAIKGSLEDRTFVAFCKANIIDKGIASNGAIHNYMNFVKATCEKFPTVGNLVQQHLLPNGTLPHDAQKQLEEKLYEAADGKDLTAFMRSLNVVREKKDPNAGDKKTPEVLTPEQQLQAWKERDTAVLRQAIDLMRSLITPDEERPRYFEKETRKAAQQLSIEFTKFLKRGTKDKKGSGTAVPAQPTKAQEKKAAQLKARLAREKERHDLSEAYHRKMDALAAAKAKTAKS